MTKKLYLHIGQSKTGTTTIQSYLFKQNRLLNNLDVDYHPELIRYTKYPAHYGVYEAVRNGDPSYLLDLRDKIEHSRYGKHVISCEGFWLLNDNEIDFLFEHLLASFDLKIILYLRHPLDYLLSSYRWKVSRLETTLSLVHYIDNRGDLLYYQNVVDKWSKLKDVYFEIYDYNLIQRTELISHFLKSVDINEEKLSSAIIEERNRHLSLKELYWYRLFRKILGCALSRKLLRLRLIGSTSIPQILGRWLPLVLYSKNEIKDAEEILVRLGYIDVYTKLTNTIVES